MGIGENIKRLRKRAGMTQGDLAYKVGVGRTTVTQWELGSSRPRMGKLDALAECFGIPLAELVSESPDDPAVYSSGEAIVPITTLGRVHAGPFSEEEVDSRLIEVPASVLANHPHARAAIVEGDCMSRVAPDGFAIVYDPDLEPTNGRIAIVETEQHEAVVRRWYRGGSTLMLVADSHQEFEDIVLTGDSPITLIGTVVWVQPPQEL